ncbi:UDP-N-acetylmuramoyl-tripeptide--D-alanyl-D-alanine ligase [Persephonella sp. KM09-Lau-8]|uniref:UDP-N-acetylmuramoyl-tripeptide--D-alanyl-D- alanine ligase n=1 Tax=Persephonella sp. KM09-Lau-8 TaxID=1158345 RepID=UPI000496F293|nr:UDP-N-acetylmuramoyl-tripeptide--D-alanyl-D-alanine ligase [Persephonella sp. KM09-Lau-8]
MEIKEIAKIVNGKLIGKSERKVSKFCIDSRKISQDMFFVPIKGVRFDGHQFIEDAIKKGASGYFSQIDKNIDGGILVDDTLKALTKVGIYKRKKLKKAIGITGTSGKTTTKEILRFLLSQFFNTYSTPGNYNNEIGVPLTLANIPENSEIGIFEFGARKKGDIKKLVDISQPEIRILTAIGHGHTEVFGSLEEVIKGKGEIFEGGEIAILPYSLLKHYKLDNKITFGFEDDADIQIKDIKIDFEGTEGILKIDNKLLKIKIPAINKAVIYNSAIGAAVLKYLEIDIEKGLKVLSEFQMPEGRGRLTKIKNIQIIDDTYNANPLSVKNAIDTISSLQGFKIVVLGDMLELGKESQKLHAEIGEYIVKKNINLAIFYGEKMRWTYEKAKKYIPSFYFEDKTKIAEEILKHKDKSPVVLIKGSRGMKMEEVIEILRNIS